MINREPLLFHLMLKQGITWFTLAPGTEEIMWIKSFQTSNFKYTPEFLFFKMACILQPKCNFLHGFFRCHLPVETVDVEVRITSMQGTHAFRRDRTCQIIKCNPWSTRLHPNPTLIKKMRTYLELVGKLGPKFWPQSDKSRPAQPNTNPCVRKETKVTDKRKLILTKRYKVWVVAKPKSTPRPATWPCNHP